MFRKLISSLLDYAVKKRIMSRQLVQYIKYITYIQDNIEL